MNEQTQEARPKKRLQRSKQDRVIGGVCGGLANYFGVDALLIRVGWVVLTLMGGSGLIAYLAAWAILPENESEAAKPARDPERQRKFGLIFGGLLVIFGTSLLFAQLGIHWFGLFHFLHIDIGVVVAIALILLGLYLAFSGKDPKLSLGEHTKLRRSRGERMIAGVCGGIAEHLDVDPGWVRLATILVIAYSHAIGVLAYFALALFLPEEPLPEQSLREEPEAPSGSAG